MNNDEQLIIDLEALETGIDYKTEYLKLLEEQSKINEEEKETLSTSINELSEKNITDYKINVDNQDVHYLTSMFLELKTTNLYLSLILLACATYFICTKLYNLIKNLLTVRGIF